MWTNKEIDFIQSISSGESPTDTKIRVSRQGGFDSDFYREE